MPEPDPLAILSALERYGVRYVLIGAVAARIAGAPVVTEDVDITPATDKPNLERLAAALRELSARLRTPDNSRGIAFRADAAMLRSAKLWTLTTTFGDLDIAFMPSGTRGYQDLHHEAKRIALAPRVRVEVASLRDVIRSKEAAGRDKDLAQLPILRRTLEELRRRSAKRRRS